MLTLIYMYESVYLNLNLKQKRGNQTKTMSLH